MKLTCQGINYRNCPLDIREKLALSDIQQQAALKAIAAAPQISDAIVLNTCNRTEFYLYSKKDFDVESYVEHLLTQIGIQSADKLRLYNNPIEGIEVVRHLFAVASGMDSQMLGENQIISQLQRAYSRASEQGTSRFFFHRLLHRAFSVSKAVRTQTSINCGAVSISLAAVELARSKISLAGADVLLVGAGENAALAAKYLVKAGIKKLTIASRTMESANQLAESLKTGSSILLQQVPQTLTNVDLVICSTASQQPVISVDNSAYSISQRDKELLIIDIAVPRDVQPQVGQLQGVKLYNIDHLNQRIDKNKENREAQLAEAQKIIDTHTEKFAEWLDSLDAMEVIGSLTQTYADTAREHARRYAGQFQPEDLEKLELFAESLTKKILHGPISYLKNSDDEDFTAEQLNALDMVKKMFLEKENGE